MWKINKYICCKYVGVSQCITERLKRMLSSSFFCCISSSPWKPSSSPFLRLDSMLPTLTEPPPYVSYMYLLSLLSPIFILSFSLFYDFYNTLHVSKLAPKYITYNIYSYNHWRKGFFFFFSSFHFKEFQHRVSL